MKRRIVLALVVLLFAAFAFYLGGSKKTVEVKGFIAPCVQIAVNPEVVKGIKIPCIDGGEGVIVESIKGPAIINVWGSWCAPCVEEMPHFVALAQKNKVPIIGIDVEENDVQSGKKFMRTHGITWPVLYDPDSRTKSLYGMGVPVTWFIGADGKVKFRHVGIVRSEQILFTEVEKYLGIKL